MSVTIPATETGMVRVWAIRLPLTRAPAFARPGPDWPLKAALGADWLDPAKVEAFDVADLAGLGLAGYLTAGHGVDEDALAPDADRLAAVDGWVAVVPSSAFGGRAQEIDPQAPLDFLGAWPELRARPATDRLVSEAASGGIAPAPEPAPPPPKGGAALWVSVAVAVAVLVAAALLMLLAS